MLHTKIISEYSPEYCLLLETVYGKGMMSEGGAEATENMFKGIELQGKNALDFGSGLGGTARYLAEEHQMKVVGIDINPWMIEEATKRIPKGLQSQISYVISDTDETLHFDDNVFDIIYSKGVLTHLSTKEKLFEEFYRILKPGGFLVIMDPVSNTYGKWGTHMSKMAEVDGLTIFAETQESYERLISKTGFKIINVRDDSVLYQHYNEVICEDIRTTKRDELIRMLGEKGYEENLQGYEAIVAGLREKEMKILVITAKKNI